MEFNPRRAWLGAVALAGCIAATPAWADDDEDCKAGGSLRLVNGKIHTMDKNDSIVSSVLITNGRFAAVGRHRGGDDDEGCARTINLHGRTVVPGIIDSHNHILLLGLRPGRDARLENANSFQEALDTLAARAKEAKPNEWVTSIGGFNRNQFSSKMKFPTFEDLSNAVPDNPVFIMESFQGPGMINAAAKARLASERADVSVGADGSIADGIFAPTECTKLLFHLRKSQTRESMLDGLQDAMRYA